LNLVVLAGCEFLDSPKTTRPAGVSSAQAQVDEYECRVEAEEEATKRQPPNYTAINDSTARFLFEDCMKQRGYESPPPF